MNEHRTRARACRIARVHLLQAFARIAAERVAEQRHSTRSFSADERVAHARIRADDQPRQQRMWQSSSQNRRQQAPGLKSSMTSTSPPVTPPPRILHYRPRSARDQLPRLRFPTPVAARPATRVRNSAAPPQPGPPRSMGATGEHHDPRAEPFERFAVWQARVHIRCAPPRSPTASSTLSNKLNRSRKSAGRGRQSASARTGRIRSIDTGRGKRKHTRAAAISASTRGRKVWRARANTRPRFAAPGGQAL